MRVHEFRDAHTFLDHARAFLFKDEVRHNLLLSSVLTLAKTSARGLTYLAAENGAALRGPNRRWILVADDLTSAQILAEKIPDYRSVILPSEFQNLVSGKSSTLNFMTLKKLEKLEASDGLLRTALPKDVKLLTSWSKLFAEEQDLDESPSEAAESIQKYFSTKQLFVWESPQRRPAAMGVVGGMTPKTARLSMIYTDPILRGHGYASTLVHRLAHRLLQDGKTPTLFADAKNETAKHVYEKLGFKTAASFTEVTAPA